MSDNEFLTPMEAAAQLRCSASTIRRRIKDGELVAVGAGPRTVRIPVAEWKRFITKAASGGAGAPEGSV